MDGGDRAGYKQISHVVEALYIGPDTGATKVYQSSAYNQSGWAEIRVISSGAQISAITAPGLEGSSNITSATTWEKGAILVCNQITQFKLSSDSSGGAVILYDKVIL